jgi:hypothetical protein
MEPGILTVSSRKPGVIHTPARIVAIRVGGRRTQGRRVAVQRTPSACDPVGRRRRTPAPTARGCQSPGRKKRPWVGEAQHGHRLTSEAWDVDGVGAEGDGRHRCPGSFRPCAGLLGPRPVLLAPSLISANPRRWRLVVLGGAALAECRDRPQAGETASPIAVASSSCRLSMATFTGLIVIGWGSWSGVGCWHGRVRCARHV